MHHPIFPTCLDKMKNDWWFLPNPNLIKTCQLRQSNQSTFVELEQTKPDRHQHKQAFQSSPHLCPFSASLLETKATNSSPTSALWTHRDVNAVYCTIYHSPHCGVENILTGLYLWFAGVLVWIMKRTNIIWLDVHLYWVLVSCVVLCVWPMQIEEDECMSQWKISPLMSTKWVAHSVFIICLCLCGWHCYMLVSDETLFPFRKMKPIYFLRRVHLSST